MIIRRATPDDAVAMAELLNAVIAIGGTTAYQSPWDAARMLAHYIADPALVACHVAVDQGQILGFQGLFYPDPSDPMPQGWAYIASFVRTGHAGRGIGKGLFAATRGAALAANIKTIDATIRADNAVGLSYYSAMGFVDYDRLRNVPLLDGTPVDRIRKRIDL